MSNLDLSGTGKASDAEVESAASDIFDILRIFDSPKDASSSLVLAYIKMMKAAFPPEFRAQAIEAVQAQTTLVIDILNEGWE